MRKAQATKSALCRGVVRMPESRDGMDEAQLLKVNKENEPLL